MNKNNLIRNALSQLAGALTDDNFASLVAIYDLPTCLTLKVGQALARGTMQGVMQNCYDDVVGRQLSEREVYKHYKVFDIAERTFMELAIKDDVDQMTFAMDASQLKYAFEVAEHISIEAIRQSEEKKIEILGQYYGKRFYQGPDNWQDMHQIITMTGSLTLRQIVLIRLICEGFKGYDKELFITNPPACVEINRMQDYGLWKANMAMFSDDASAEIQLKRLLPTDYSMIVYDALMLEKLSEEDLLRTIDSLKLSKDGKPAEGITKEDYEANTTWHYDGDEERLTVPGKIKEATSLPEDMPYILRGKDLMNEAILSSRTSQMLESIDLVMTAISEYEKCKSEMLAQPAIDDALKVLVGLFDECKEEGELRILRGKRNDYKIILDNLHGKDVDTCKSFVLSATEREAGFDQELSEKEMDSWFKNAISEAETKNK